MKEDKSSLPLAGQVALVTGAAKGIGKACCDIAGIVVSAGFEMAQPSKSVQLTGPGLIGRHNFERRLIAEMDDGTCQSELTKFDLGPEAWVSRAQILWDNQNIAESRGAVTPAEGRCVQDARDGRAARALSG